MLDVSERALVMTSTLSGNHYGFGDRRKRKKQTEGRRPKSVKSQAVSISGRAGRGVCHRLKQRGGIGPEHVSSSQLRPDLNRSLQAAFRSGLNPPSDGSGSHAGIELKFGLSGRRWRYATDFCNGVVCHHR
jgi:hypothetical protein